MTQRLEIREPGYYITILHFMKWLQNLVSVLLLLTGNSCVVLFCSYLQHAVRKYVKSLPLALVISSGNSATAIYL